MAARAELVPVVRIQRAARAFFAADERQTKAKLRRRIVRQQATIGPCNKPRPGMWDSAEDKARYEAWKKLDTMPKAEAMHLYVQAIEVFDEDWLSWDGLQSDPIVQAFAPPPTPQNGKGDAEADVVHAAVRAMRALRQSVGRLPPASLAAAREECAALQRAIDQRAAS